MISLKKLRNTAKFFKEKLTLKQDNTNLEIILNLDEKTRDLKTKANNLRSLRNSASEAIGFAKKQGLDASKSINETRELGDSLKKIENELNF